MQRLEQGDAFRRPGGTGMGCRARFPAMNGRTISSGACGTKAWAGRTECNGGALAEVSGLQRPGTTVLREVVGHGWPRQLIFQTKAGRWKHLNDLGIGHASGARHAGRHRRSATMSTRAGDGRPPGARFCEPQQRCKVKTLPSISQQSLSGGVAAGYKPALRGSANMATIQGERPSRTGCPASREWFLPNEPKSFSCVSAATVVPCIEISSFEKRKTNPNRSQGDGKTNLAKPRRLQYVGRNISRLGADHFRLCAELFYH